MHQFLNQALDCTLQLLVSLTWRIYLYTKGGFIVTKKMLDMFKRPDDPPEYYHLYGIPAAGTFAFYGAGSMSGHVPEIDSAAATLSGLLCIGGIGGLSSQSTARLGAASGQAGVALGVASTM